MNRLIIFLSLFLFLSGCSTKTPDEPVQQAETPAARPQSTDTSFVSEDWYDQMEIFQLHREPARASLMPYESIQQAMEAEHTVLDDTDYTVSPYIQSLNGEWSFSFSDSVQHRLKDLKGYEAPYYWETWDTTDWDKIMVPSNIQTQKNEDGTFRYEPPLYLNLSYPWLNWESIRYGALGQPVAPTINNSVGHYKREFTLDPQWKDKSVFLRFDGVESAYYVYINGQQIGYSEDSYTAHEFNITPYLNDEVNTLAVEVIRWSDGSYFENQDFIRLSGIFRDVTLIARDDVEIRDVFVHTDPDLNGNALFSVDLDIRNTSMEIQEGWKVRTDLLYQGTSVLDQALVSDIETLQPAPTESTTGSRITLEEEIRNVHLWYPDDPQLYHFTMELIRPDGTVAEALVQRVGFREITVDNSTGKDRILLNGKPFLLKGVNRHETDPVKGRAIGKEEILTDLTMMKSYNINSFRMSHYPNQSVTYDIADEIGLIIASEANIESHIGERELHVPGNNPLYNSLILDRTMNMVEQHKNHASVLFWSLGNESTYSEYPMDENYPFYNSSLWILERDPSRLRIYERDNRIGQDREHSMVDVRSTQYWSLDKLESYAGSDSHGLFQSEYIHAMGNGVGNLDEYYQLFRKHEQLYGGFIWDFIDQTILTTDPETKETFYGHGKDWGQELNDGYFCANGIINADRTPGPEIVEVKKVQQDVLFDYDPETSELTITNEFLNTPVNHFRLDLNYYQDGILYHTETVSDALLAIPAGSQGVIDITVPEAEGEIILEAYLSYKEDQNWANLWGGHKGDCLAFEQFIIQHNQTQHTVLPEGSMEVIQGDTLTIKGNEVPFTLSFDPQTMQIKDLQINDKTIVTNGPVPSFHRAKVDNDPWLPDSVRLAGKQIQYQKPQVELIRKDDQIQQVILRAEGTINEFDTPISTQITISAQGRIKVDMTMQVPPIDWIGYLPRIGTEISLDPSVTDIRYYGKGPHENYVDRNTGSPLGIWTIPVNEFCNEQMIKPQDTGNRTEVRNLSLISEQGNLDIEFSQPGGFNVVPYDEKSLEEAMHYYQATKLDHPILHLDLCQLGLGNASLGQDQLPQYRIQQDIPHKFSYTMTVRP